MIEILDRMRQAVNASAYTQTGDHWQLAGPHVGLGHSTTCTVRFDRDGRFLRHVEGPLESREAFDGQLGWRTDLTGMSGVFELADLDHAKLDIYISTGLWLVNPNLIHVVDVEARPGSSEIGLQLRLPDSPLPARLWVDTASALPKRLEVSGLAGLAVRHFHDFAGRNGIQLPRRMTRTLSQQQESATQVHVLEQRAPDTAAFQRPASPQDARFDSPSSHVSLRFAPTGHLLVQPKINGIGTDAFIFDTGAGQSGVHLEMPTEFGLQQVGSGLTVSIFGVQNNPIMKAE